VPKSAGIYSRSLDFSRFKMIVGVAVVAFMNASGSFSRLGDLLLALVYLHVETATANHLPLFQLYRGLFEMTWS